MASLTLGNNSELLWSSVIMAQRFCAKHCCDINQLVVFFTSSTCATHHLENRERTGDDQLVTKPSSSFAETHVVCIGRRPSLLTDVWVLVLVAITCDKNDYRDWEAHYACYPSHKHCTKCYSWSNEDLVWFSWRNRGNASFPWVRFFFFDYFHLSYRYFPLRACMK